MGIYKKVITDIEESLRLGKSQRHYESFLIRKYKDYLTEQEAFKMVNKNLQLLDFEQWLQRNEIGMMKLYVHTKKRGLL